MLAGCMCSSTSLILAGIHAARDSGRPYSRARGSLDICIIHVVKSTARLRYPPSSAGRDVIERSSQVDRLVRGTSNLCA